ncbi:hypothetical protein [Streptomyces europaeiscabiei]|uniref:hypothetical protein n=1 Tax=Streptomyces europaeiscabiei TaxID=146819 RepID=UPI0029C9FC3A|nr:hypothetical protein [Streptomyces europaeiscabiei]
MAASGAEGLTAEIGGPEDAGRRGRAPGRAVVRQIVVALGATADRARLGASFRVAKGRGALRPMTPDGSCGSRSWPRSTSRPYSVPTTARARTRDRCRT